MDTADQSWLLVAIYMHAQNVFLHGNSLSSDILSYYASDFNSIGHNGGNTTQYEGSYLKYPR